MGGEATFSGTTYQARVIAFVYAHVLAQMRLGWLGAADDTPLAVSGESGGPGDDIRIELGEKHPPIEAQAKHGLSGGAKLREVFDRIRDTTTPPNRPIVIVTVDRGSSRKVWVEVASDLDRVRSGRKDGLRTETTNLVEEYGADLVIGVRVVPIDVDHAHGPEAKSALGLLQDVLEDPSQANAAWHVLVSDAGELWARRLRRTRKDLVDLLAGNSIKVKHPKKDERWHRQLDFSRELLRRRHAATCLLVLSQLEGDLGSALVEPLVRYRLAHQRSAAFFQLDRYDDALQAARRALDIDADGVLALTTGGLAAALGGDFQAATAFVEHAIAVAPENATAWGAKTQVAALAGESIPTPPDSVALSHEYRTTLAQIAFNNNDWDGVLSLTSALLAEDIRSPEVLLFRATALLSKDRGGHDEQDTERFENADRLATELIEVLNDDAHPYTRKALIVRANARRFLERNADADADIARAQSIDADDPDAVGHAARWKYEAGDEEGALHLLRHPVVDQAPMLLVLRARILAARGEHTAARRDLESALGQISAAWDQDTLRFACSDLALVLGDEDLAMRTLDGVSKAGTLDARYYALRARAALTHGAVEEGEMLYEQAATVDEANRPSYVAELGVHLRRLGRPTDAVRVFQSVAEEALPKGAIRSYAVALVEANQLLSAQQLLDRLAAVGQLPEWALGVAIEIATRQEDEDTAIRHLAELVARGQPDRAARIDLVRRLIEMGRPDDARDHLDALVADKELTAVERMQTAQLLHAAGRTSEGLPLAFRAFREAPQDPRFHRALIFLSIGDNTPLPPVTEVGSDTYVRLRNQDGDVRAHTVYSEAPIDPLRGEMTVTDARSADILGRKVGHVIVRNQGTWQEERWTVEEILSAIHHAIQDAMLHYEERFPSEPLFLKGFKIGDGTSVRDFAPIIASLEARKAHAEHVLTQYRKEGLPLGLIAKTLGASMPDVMDQIIADPAAPGPLFVEWADRQGQEESRMAALGAVDVVVTRSALYTASERGLLASLGSTYTIVAPRSLNGELRDEIAEVNRLVRDGQQVLMSGGTGLAMQNLEPGHPYLVGRLLHLRTVQEWLEKTARLEPRPLESVQPPGSREEEARQIVGRSSYDAMVLARHRGFAIYADDLGLRRFLPVEQRVRSFSTIGLVRSLAERGTLSADERDRHLVELVRRRYVTVPASRQLVDYAIRNSATVDRALLAQVLGLVRGVSMTPAEAARMIAEAIRSLVTASVQMMPADDVAQMGLEAMALRWPRSLCAQALTRAAREELALLPQHLLVVQRACSAFAKPRLGPRSS